MGSSIASMIQLLERNFLVTPDFRVQLALLRRLRVIPLGELASMLEERRVPQRGTTVAITFDDGYANNLYAAELLAAARLPWAVFVTTGPVDAGTTIWTAELSMLLLHGNSRAAGTVRPALAARIPYRARDRVPSTAQPFKSLPAADRVRAMSALRSQFPAEESRRLLSKFPFAAQHDGHPSA